MIPLAIVQAHAPKPAPAGFTLGELIKPGVGLEFGNSDGFFSWRTLFISLDRAFKFWAVKALRGRPLKSIRAKALDTLEFMVSLDVYLNETSRHAHVILPGLSPLEQSHFPLAFTQLAVRNFVRYSRPA